MELVLENIPNLKYAADKAEFRTENYGRRDTSFTFKGLTIEQLCIYFVIKTRNDPQFDTL